MTLTSWLWAFLMIAAPDPGSRSTSRITFAPFVMAWSAWLAWVAGSPWAFTIVCGTPAAVNAWSRYLRSWVSQRTDDLVSGSSTATLPALLAVVDEPPLLLVLSLLSLPHPATAKARAAHATAIPATKPGERLIIRGTSSSGRTPTPGSFSARRAGCWCWLVRLMRQPRFQQVGGCGSRPIGRIRRSRARAHRGSRCE